MRYLATALVIVAVFVTWNLVDRPARPAPMRPATAAARMPARAPLVVPPTASDLLVRGNALRLTAPQRARLEALAADWDREVAPLEARMRTATDEFTRYMAEAERTGRARLDDMRARSAEVQELSAALRGRRARHADAASAVLTESQKTYLSGGSR